MLFTTEVVLGPRSRKGSVGLVLFCRAPWRGFYEWPWFGAPYYFGNTVTNTLANELIQKFKDIFEKTHNNRPPDWAWPFKPSIPLVGENYKPGKGLLIYASAENLSWHNNKKDSPLHQFFTEENAWNRYRIQYDEYCSKPNKSHPKVYFPNVGIQPVSDGGLLAAGLFTAIKYGLQQEESPRSFLETIAVTNWNKFSIRSPGKNEDIRGIKKLTASLAFVVAELMVLQPAVVLIPRTAWRHLKLQAAMQEASPQSKFLPAPQFNATVVNCHLRQYDRLASQLKNELANTPLASWMENVRRVSRKHAWRYIAMLDGIATQE